MVHYPLVFDVRLPVFGNGFVAGITLSGAALARQEGEREWWLDGVHPGALAASGDSLKDGHRAFVQTIEHVFYDMANSFSRFKDFKSAVKKFFDECDEDTLAAFERARVAVREGAIPKTELPRKSNPQFCIKVEQLRMEVFSPKHNAAQGQYQVAA